MGVTSDVIVVEDRLQEMFDTLDAVSNGKGTDFQPQFEYGDSIELTSFLKENRQLNEPYPLIWLVYPYTENHTVDKVDLTSLSLVLAVPSNGVMYNSERLHETFKALLYPLLKNILKVFRRSNIIDTVYDYEMVKHPKYSTNVNKNEVPIIWDAIKITFDTSINSDCYRKPNKTE